MREKRKAAEVFTRSFLSITLVSAFLSFAGDALSSEDKDSVKTKEAGPASGSLTAIKVYFKLDPRITKGTYMGERWVSPPSYGGAQDGKKFIAEARAQGLDAKGKPIVISPKWLPADPEMVAVAPGEGSDVRITVLREGESSLEVVADGVSKKLSIKAAYQDNAIQVAISQ